MCITIGIQKFIGAAGVTSIAIAVAACYKGYEAGLKTSKATAKDVVQEAVGRQAGCQRMSCRL